MSTERTIRGERDDDGHWVAWLADAPQNAFGAESASAALVRVLRSMHPPRNLSDVEIPLVWTADEIGRFEVNFRTDVCPDCQGTGQYIGLHEVESCGLCLGRGRLPLNQFRDDPGL